MSKYTHSFHGVPMTANQFVLALYKKAHGHCPFCGDMLKKNYGADNKHLKACGKGHLRELSENRGIIALTP